MNLDDNVNILNLLYEQRYRIYILRRKLGISHKQILQKAEDKDLMDDFKVLYEMESKL